MPKNAASTVESSESSYPLSFTDKMMAAACNLENSYLNKKYLEGINAVADPLNKTDTVLTVISRSMTVLNLLLNASNAIANVLPVLRLVCSFVDLMVLIALFSLYAIASFLKDEDSAPVKAFKFLIPVVLIGLFIASFTLSLVELSISIFTIFLANKLWDLSRKLINCFSGEWKTLAEEKKELKKQIADCRDPHELEDLQKQLFEKKNRLITFRGELAESIHSAVCGAISLIGAVLLIPPFTPIGVGILFCIGFYSLLDTFGHNPFRFIANKVFNNPFKPIDLEAATIPTETPRVKITPTFETADIQKRISAHAENVADKKAGEAKPLLNTEAAPSNIIPQNNALPSLTGNKNTQFADDLSSIIAARVHRVNSGDSLRMNGGRFGGKR